MKLTNKQAAQIAVSAIKKSSSREELEKWMQRVDELLKATA